LPALQFDFKAVQHGDTVKVSIPLFRTGSAGVDGFSFVAGEFPYSLFVAAVLAQQFRHVLVSM
jgi:hypothetical protein